MHKEIIQTDTTIFPEYHIKGDDCAALWKYKDITQDPTE